MPNPRLSEKEFMDKLLQIVEENISDEAFGVSQLANEMCMCRSNLHRKVQSYKQIPVSHLINQVRLQQALELLHTTSDTVAEVAYQVGYSSPSYFIKCFHDHYGYTPGQAVSKGNYETFEQTENSIIVLPFENMSPDADQEYFCDGLTEELIMELTHIKELMVISRSSAMTFKGTQQTIKEIAQTVKVKYVLEGSVRRISDQLKITAQLIDAENDYHLWAEKYYGSSEDIFDIQEKVSRSIVDSLRVTLSPQEDKALSERPIGDPRAYDCYLRALREMEQANEISIKKAMHDLQAALDIIGDNALIYAGMGTGYSYYYEFGISVTEETLSKAEHYAIKAQNLSPDCSSVFSLLGRIERFRGNAHKALSYFKQAKEIYPFDIEALSWMAIDYNWKFGRSDLAFPIIQKLNERDPLSPLVHLITGLYNWLIGNVDKALSSYNNLLKLVPDHLLAKFWSTYALFWSKQYDQACAIIDDLTQVESQGQMHKLFTGWLLFLKHAIKGEKSKAMDYLNKDLLEYLWRDPDLPWLCAGGWALIDEKDEAMHWLQHAVNKGCINYPVLSETDPFLKNIREEKSFRQLMKRVKYEWEYSDG